MIFKNIDVVTKDQVLTHQTVQIKEGKFISIKPSKEQDEGIDYQGYLLVPGFIDLHQHGTFGYDMMDATPNAVEGISKHLLKEGTTRFLATTMTLSEDAILKALKAYPASNPQGAKPLGIHLEGPFISKAFPGAQDPAFIMKGTINLFDAFQAASNGAIKLVTLAPEEQDEAFLKYLIHQGIVVSMGHSAATEKDVEKALKLGIKRVTHCFNAMSKLHHRDLGLVGMTLLHDEIEAELIADGIHTTENAMRLLTKIKKDKVSIVTDGIRAKGLNEGTYELGGQTIHLKEGAARLESGTLAGSVLFMDQALRKMLQLGIDLPEVVRMLSYNPAITMDQHHHLGQIKENYLADCVVLDQNHHVMETYVEGQLLFKNEQD
jgi:N-acetylglucosamine-6-phosphate deacetylase